jgi:probable O-glycosylation ligase (exosortase A-associated)
MNTINDYQEDASAQGRINAWKMAWNLAVDRVLIGGGFNVYMPDVFARYAPIPEARAAHSIYFQVLGEHGFVGLFLFLLIWILTWSHAKKIVRAVGRDPELSWARELALMVQVSLVGYAVGGAFLSLAYFDLPYDLMICIVVTSAIIRQRAASATGPLPASTPALNGAPSAGAASAPHAAGGRPALS